MQSETLSAADAAFPSFARSLFERLGAISRRLMRTREPKRLRLCETLSLGNRGYVAVVRYHDQQFLVGGTSSSVALLAELSSPLSSEPRATGTPNSGEKPRVSE
ncbi:MAG: flagellar biosynthetic protein FliO [Candidatus Acidiferrales bacterium]